MAPADHPHPTPQEETIGYLLWQRRLALGLEPEEIETQIKIRHHYLTAIEHNDYEDLPGPAYTLGYIKNYARFLGIDPNEIEARFLSEQEAFHKEQAFYLPEPARQRRGAERVPLMLSLLLAVLIYTGWFLLIHRDEPRYAGIQVQPVPDRLMTGERPSASREMMVGPMLPQTQRPARGTANTVDRTTSAP